MWPLRYFHITIFTDCLALWNEFKVNNIEESDEHFFIWNIDIEGFLDREDVGVSNENVLFNFGIILKAPRFISFLISHKI
jgi:hypothetical protein